MSFNIHANVRDGIYVGAGAGNSFDNLNLITDRLSSGLSINNDASNNNWLAQVFAGYGANLFEGYFLAGEIGANFPSHSVTIPARPDLASFNFVVSDTLAIQDYVTFDVLPGYSLTENILLYGRAGLSYSSLTLKQPRSFFMNKVDANQSKLGGRFGLGANLSVSQNIAVGLDYFYTFYQDMNVYAFPNTHFATRASSNFLGLSLLYQI